MNDPAFPAPDPSPPAAPDPKGGLPGEASPSGPPPAPPPCAKCRRALKPEAAFCSYCGHRVGDPAPIVPRREGLTQIRRRIQTEWQAVQAMIFFYVAMLAIQVVALIMAKSGVAEFNVMAAGDALLGAVTLGVAFHYRNVIRPLYATPGWGPVGYGLVLLGAVPIFLSVHTFVYILQKLFHMHAERYLDAFEGRSILWAVFFICFNAAVFEELAFRGVIFTRLKQFVSPTEAFLISSFAFAILHLSPLFLATHVLLGLYLCWLREVSGSLYPGMLAHFMHNALVLLDERCGLLPVFNG